MKEMLTSPSKYTLTQNQNNTTMAVTRESYNTIMHGSSIGNLTQHLRESGKTNRSKAIDTGSILNQLSSLNQLQNSLFAGKNAWDLNSTQLSLLQQSQLKSKKKSADYRSSADARLPRHNNIPISERVESAGSHAGPARCSELGSRVLQSRKRTEDRTHEARKSIGLRSTVFG